MIEDIAEFITYIVMITYIWRGVELIVLGHHPNAVDSIMTLAWAGSLMIATRRP